MKILQLIPNIAGGGAERFTVDLSNELTKNNEVHLVSLYNPQEKDLFREAISSGVKTYSVGKELGLDYKVFKRLYDKINLIKPDIIHSHLRSFNYLMPAIPFLKRIPVVHTVHSDAFKECTNSLLRKVRQWCFKSFNVIPITISKASSRSFNKAYGCINQKLIYNGREFPAKSNDFKEVQKEINCKKNNSDTKVFVHIGRLQVEKNQHMLVQAFTRMVSNDKGNAILIIIGGERDNEKGRKVKKQLKQAEARCDHIYILGERPNATDYLHVADCFCLSSLYEGMPITLIEAFATETIPVCTPVGGIPEMVEELDESLLSKSVNVEDYYETLKRAYFLEEEEQCMLMRRSRVLFDKKYSIEYCTEKYQELYAGLIKN